MKILKTSLAAIGLLLATTTLTFAIPCSTQNDHCRNYSKLSILQFLPVFSAPGNAGSDHFSYPGPGFLPLASNLSDSSGISLINSDAGPVNHQNGPLTNGPLTNGPVAHGPVPGGPVFGSPILPTGVSAPDPSLIFPGPDGGLPPENNEPNSLSVPEPGTLLLLGLGLFGLSLSQRKWKRN